MTTDTKQEHPRTNEELEHEMQGLEAELEEIRREVMVKRARNSAVQLAAVVGVVLGLAALGIAAFKLDDTQNPAVSMPNQIGSNMMAGAGAGSAATQSSVGQTSHVTAQLGDYWIRPNVTTVPAGSVTFTATNAGQVPHELMVERMPIKMDAPMQPNEDAAQGMINDMGPGESGHMTLNLKPGMYMLFCNVPGHYAAGQHTTFRVTG
jgi:uncharacterized cupredoxin-like copper-binding protein